ncbi:CDAN1-interacting nuclease 1-like [Oppia nitens]|uniref:CDAN1-interacting nuclease 1-like n=1 Tax=Oppia nitens TaxID=1686743 RepID=UPI0023DC4278|nr:CDAN1-interacting nuclease 1-like [Oppia nitens]
MKRRHYYQIISEYRRLRSLYGTDLRQICLQLIRQFGQLIASYNSSDRTAAATVADNDTDRSDDQHWIQCVIYSLAAYEFKCEIKPSAASVTAAIASYGVSNNNNIKSLMNIAQEVGISYTMAAQYVLQNRYNHDKSLTKTMSANTSHIADGRLAVDVMLCHLNDIVFGNHSNHMTNNSGLVFESEVSQLLHRNDISYVSERQLRIDDCFDVTPDFKLNVPLIVKTLGVANNTVAANHCTDGSDICLIKVNNYFAKNNTKFIVDNDSTANYTPINWIECKSMFASDLCHSKYYRNQYSNYVNRFGSGLVIYKYGYVRPVPVQYTLNIIITDRLPKIMHTF